MGLDASVLCNCWKEGRIKPPPFPAEFIGFDEEGYLELKVAWEGNQEMHDAFDKWQHTCCEHEDMRAADEWVSNWFAYRYFQHALERAGWEKFPALKTGLPEANGGTMPASLCEKALQELDFFKHEARLGTEMFLINTETGTSVKQCEGIWIFDGRARVNIGIDRNGFFIISQEAPQEQFRAMRLEQRVDEAQSETGALFINLDTGAQFVGTCNVTEYIQWPDGKWTNESGQPNMLLPRLMHIEERKLNADYFNYILEPLTRLFKASVETGNPVRWS